MIQDDDLTRNPALPDLGWVSSVRAGCRFPRLSACVGRYVEELQDGFYEGVWAGRFEQGAPAGSAVSIGSGVVRTEDGCLLVIPPTHTMEKLFSIREASCIYYSNSLPLLLAYTNEDLDHSHRLYTSQLMSFLRGLDSAVTSVPLASGKSLRLHYYHGVRIDNELSERREERIALPRVSTFEEYTALWQAYVMDTVENGRSGDRNLTYAPLATLSTGYDSPAIAALVLESGGSRAITFREGREAFGTSVDSGKTIGQYLGIEVAEYNRLAFLKRTDLPELPFLASGVGAEDVVFASAETELRGKILFTGIGGDTLWEDEHSNPSASRDFVLKYPAGASFQEYRVRIGFQHFPLPLLGLPQHPDVHAISNSEEMDRWRLGTVGYDRPIPRRIAEEAGVPRSLFGQVKKAVAQPMDHCYALSRFVGPSTEQAFKQGWHSDAAGVTRSGRLFTRGLMRLAQSGLTRLLSAGLSRVFRRPVEIERRLIPTYLRRYSEYEDSFHWSISVLKSDTIRRPSLGSVRDPA